MTVLRVIKAAQRLGFTLEEISDLLEAGQHRHSRNPDEGLQARARDKLVDVEAKIADLTVIAASLRTALDAGCDDLIDCAHSSGCPLPFADLATGTPLQLVEGSEQRRGCRPVTDREVPSAVAGDHGSYSWSGAYRGSGAFVWRPRAAVCMELLAMSVGRRDRQRVSAPGQGLSSRR
ncbi:MerR family DNA-binding protein [Kribbella sp. NPDC051718]|uniref:MerR family DNA-binding protein n=1 Tax=Kribbella sp. NPDC051718 TaxID=3155168 RepID=UPI00341F14A1